MQHKNKRSNTDISRFGAGRSLATNSVLLYGFGLALAFSLLFNGFLLYEQSHQHSVYDYEVGTPLDPAVSQQQLSDYRRDIPPKDSLTLGSKQVPNSPAGQSAAAQRRPSK